MAKFEPALILVLKNEGGICNNPDDAGGITSHGISLRFYRKKIKVDATEDDIRNLPSEAIAEIYEEYFWNRQQYELINNQRLANRIFDLSVNLGPSAANKLLQQATNAIKPDTHLVLDGALGAKSFAAINSCDPHMLYDALITNANDYYHHIATHGNNYKFLNGWVRRLVSEC